MTFQAVIDAREDAKKQLSTLRETLAIRRRAAAARGESKSAHPDDIAVDQFAAAMKAKLAQKREEDRGGWDDKDDCSNAFLSKLLHEHVEKGDPVDVGNFAMMIHQRDERIAAPSAPVSGEAVARHAPVVKPLPDPPQPLMYPNAEWCEAYERWHRIWARWSLGIAAGPPQPDAIRLAVEAETDRCARLIEQNSIMDSGGEKFLRPRHGGDVNGLAYAQAIRSTASLQTEEPR